MRPYSPRHAKQPIPTVTQAAREARAPAAVRLEGIEVKLSGRVIISGVSLVASPGDVIGLMGPNGAGKSTFLTMLAGLIIPSCGTGTVLGVELGSGASPACGMMFEHPPFIDERSGLSNLSLLASYGRPAVWDLAELMERVGLDPKRRARVGSYSQGMRKRLGLAQAIMSRPGLLLLDEPMNGLDPQGIAMMRETIASSAREGAAVIVSSHLLGELEAMCNRVFMVAGGRFEELDASLIREHRLEEEYLRRFGGR